MSMDRWSIIVHLNYEYVSVCILRIDGSSAYILTFGVKEDHRKRKVESKCLGEIERYLRRDWDY